MKVYVPTSAKRVTGFACVADFVSVALAGPLAAWLRDPGLFESSRLGPSLQFCSVSMAVGVLMLLVFHPGSSVIVSRREVQVVLATTVWTAATTALIYLVLDERRDIPRSLPAIHFLVLTSLMLGGRVVVSRGGDREGCAPPEYTFDSQHMLVIAANAITVSYLKMLEAFNADLSSIVGILDDDRRRLGRSLRGVPIVAPTNALAQMIEEYRVHGVEIDRVLFAANRQDRAGIVARDDLENVCRAAGIPFEYLGDVLGLRPERSAPTPAPVSRRPSRLAGKRLVDIVAALALSVLILPLIALVTLAVALDLGWPPIFWQKRVGCNGRPFLIYKFRTLHAPYDRRGRAIAEAERFSRLGAFLRRTRLDEAPQLVNVLRGDMSLVGPRPLLPIDQPADTGARLLMRPGITGWAQIKGGRRISAAEKGALDDWYVRNASFFLDLSILAQTVIVVVRGDRGSPVAVADAAPVVGREGDGKLTLAGDRQPGRGGSFDPRGAHLLTPSPRL
jgi:lipopolysaccharide/colanic/teichoic acid biosynthesis glycosyltransferase